MFGWDPQKAQKNTDKHGVTFDEAGAIFFDPDALDGPDLPHSHVEARSRRLGTSVEGRVLTVVYTVRSTGHAETILNLPRFGGHLR